MSIDKAALERLQGNIPLLERFVPGHMVSVLMENVKGEEGAHFVEVLNGLAKTIDEMPKTYDQDGKGDEAVAYLHYFAGGADWYITEKDVEVQQLQAFGLADMGEPELGYISIKEIIKHPQVEIDLYFEPMTLKDVRAKVQKKYSPR